MCWRKRRRRSRFVEPLRATLHEADAESRHRHGRRLDAVAGDPDACVDTRAGIDHRFRAARAAGRRCCRHSAQRAIQDLRLIAPWLDGRADDPWPATPAMPTLRQCADAGADIWATAVVAVAERDATVARAPPAALRNWSGSRREAASYAQMDFAVPVRRLPPPACDRLQRRRPPPGRGLLRPARLRGAARQFRRDRPGPVAAGELVRAGPPADAKSTASRRCCRGAARCSNT